MTKTEEKRMKGTLRLSLFVAIVSLAGAFGLTGCGSVLQGEHKEKQRITENNRA